MKTHDENIKTQYMYMKTFIETFNVDHCANAPEVTFKLRNIQISLRCF